MTFGSPETVALSVIRQGVGIMLAGLLWGFFIPQTPFPRLALTAHIQFEAEGAMVLLIGLLLNSKPFPKSDIKLAHALSPLQSKLILLGCTGVWPVILSEVANSWWGTKDTLPILFATGVPSGWSATKLQEFIVMLAHFGGAPFIVVAMGILLFALFKEPQANSGGKKD